MCFVCNNNNKEEAKNTPMRKVYLPAAAALCGAATIVLLSAAEGPAALPRVQFEGEATKIAAGKSPKILTRRQHGMFVVYSKPSGERGADLWMQTTPDLGDSFTDPIRVNDIAGEVSDHGENSAQLLGSPGERELYVVWNARDPKQPSGSLIRFAKSDGMNVRFGPAVTLNDDNLPVSHSFQGAAVGPDGAIYVAWLDGRERASGKNMEGTSAIYLARSTDGGKTWSKNLRVAGNVCPCCRASIGFAKGNVIVAWRGVEKGDLRDITIAVSADKGETWSAPKVAARDGWRMNGCPHVGPALASIGDTLALSWFTEANDQPSVYYAESRDGGVTFTPKRKISDNAVDPTHPALVTDGKKFGVVFQARAEGSEKRWGKFVTYYREILPGGIAAPLVRAGEGKANAVYPAAALGFSGRVFLAWSETTAEGTSSYLLRGRPSTGR